MDYLYIIVCFLIALFLPHLTIDSVSVGAQILLQVAFIIVGIVGFRAFSE